MMATAPISVGLALFAGILTVLSPCVLPILPIVVGRSLSTHTLGPIALVSGLVASFAVAGSLLGITTGWLTGLMSFLRSFSIFLLLLLGILTLFPDWSYRLFSYLRIDRLIKEPKQVGLIGEFWLGTQLGFLWTPCAGPVLGSILVLSVDRQFAGALGLLVAYGIGAALPMLAIAYGGRQVSQRFVKLRASSKLLTRIGGGVIIATAIAILLGWDVQVQLWLAPFFPTIKL
jgi:cytochrome c biogenesis protein CcdA